jgi:hypothetical protein
MFLSENVAQGWCFAAVDRGCGGFSHMPRRGAPQPTHLFGHKDVEVMWRPLDIDARVARLSSRLVVAAEPCAPRARWVPLAASGRVPEF